MSGMFTRSFSTIYLCPAAINQLYSSLASTAKPMKFLLVRYVLFSMILLFPCFSYKRHCSDLFSLPSLPKYPVKLSCIPRTLEAVFSCKFVNYPASATSFITKSSNPKEVLSTFVLVRTIVCLYNVDCNESTSLIQPLFIIKVDYKTKACIVEHMIVFLTFTNGHFSPVGKNKHNTNSGVVVNGTIICFCCPQIKGGTKVSRCI